ncbi:MAG TPA: LysR family transcriptional regulator [Acidimicrobiales bacterium]|nr:LysR family transcriptional regulator [Acidimicrobiales bacterium]
MDLRQLHAIVAIAEHGSFSAAAEALQTVQSNVSTHVKKLEQELGTDLVDRSSGALTDAGELVVARARRVMGEIDALSADVSALRDEVSGVVRVGVIGTAARWLVPPLVELVPERYPHLRLVIMEATTAGLGDQLASGQVDIGVLGLPAAGGDLRTMPLFEEDLVLVLPKSHPLAIAPLVRLTDLPGLPLLLPLRGVAYRDELDAVTAAHRVQLTPRVEMDSIRLISGLTFDGCGYAILPSGAVSERRSQEWALVPVEGLAPRLVGVAQRRRGLPSAPVRAVLQLLQDIVGDGTRTPRGIRPVAFDLARFGAPEADGSNRRVRALS